MDRAVGAPKGLWGHVPGALPQAGIGRALGPYSSWQDKHSVELFWAHRRRVREAHWAGERGQCTAARTEGGIHVCRGEDLVIAARNAVPGDDAARARQFCDLEQRSAVLRIGSCQVFLLVGEAIPVWIARGAIEARRIGRTKAVLRFPKIR